MGGISVNIAYNVDCMEYMRTLPDKAFDLAVVDPPYFSGPERRGYYGSRVSKIGVHRDCLLYTSPSPRDYAASRMPSSA